MTRLGASVLAGLCVAAFACHDTPSGSQTGGGNGRPVEGTGHTGDVKPANGTSGDPAASPNAPGGSTATTANPTYGNGAPSGNGNSNSDIPQPAMGMNDAGASDAGDSDANRR